jgi:hypothetical protein
LKSIEPNNKIKFRSKYTALISLLKEKLDPKSYVKECGLIKKILNAGYTEKQIYSVFNYYSFKGKRINSYTLFVWNDYQLIKEALPHILDKENEEEFVQVSYNQDFRTNREYKVYRKSLIEFLTQ